MSKTYKSISIVFLITIGIKIIDIIKNLIIAAKIGVSNDADVFSALISVPDSLLVLVGIDSVRGIVNSEYSTLYSNKDYSVINDSFNNLFKIIFAFSIPFFLLIYIFNSQLISLFFPGFEGIKKDLAVQLSYFIFPVFIFKALGGFIQSLYNSSKRFYFPVMLSVLISICMIVSIFLPLRNDNLIFNLSIGYLLGNALIVFFMITNFNKLEISVDLSFPKFDELSKKIIKSCGSITILVLLNQLFLSSRMFFASYYGEGAISSLNYSSAITSFITSLAFNSVFSVLLSNISSLDFKKDIDEIKRLYLGTIEVILYLFIPVASLFIIFDIDIIKLFYFRGNFTAEGIEKVSYPFVWDSLSILSWIMYIIPTAFFLAIKKYRILSIYGSIAYITGIFLNYYMSDMLGYYGVAVASFLTTSFYSVFLLYQSKKILIDMSSFRLNTLKIIVCGLISFAVIFLIKKKYLNITFPDNSLLILISGALMYLAVYMFSSHFLKLSYLGSIRKYIR